MNELIEITRNELEARTKLTPEEGLKGSAAIQILSAIEGKMPNEMNDEDCEIVIRAGKKTELMLMGSNSEDCLVSLRRLKAFKGRRDADQGEWAHVLATLSRDLSKRPQWAVDLACGRYQKRADRPYFPNCADDLMQLVSSELRQWRQARQAWERLNHLEDQYQALGDIF